MSSASSVTTQPSVPSRAQGAHRRQALLVGWLALVAFLPFAVAGLFPSVDGPSHLNTAGVLAMLRAGTAPAVAAFFEEADPGLSNVLAPWLLSRLLDAMEDLGMVESAQTTAQVFIPFFDAGHLGDYFHLAAKLRAADLATEVYPEPAKLGKQLQYADRKGFRVAVIAGEREFAVGECQIKNLATTESITVPMAEVVAEVARILAK